MQRLGDEVGHEVVIGVGVLAQIADQAEDQQVERLVHVRNLDLVEARVLLRGRIGQITGDRLRGAAQELQVERGVLVLKEELSEGITLKELRAQEPDATAQRAGDVQVGTRLVPLAHSPDKAVGVAVEYGVGDVFLAIEIVVKEAAGNPRGLSDVLDRRALNALALVEVERGSNDLPSKKIDELVDRI